jgi:hypothetical protein
MAAAMKFNPDVHVQTLSHRPQLAIFPMIERWRGQNDQPKSDWDHHDEESRVQEVIIARRRLLNQGGPWVP